MNPLEPVWASFPEPFNYYRLMLGGDHLHFGYWPEGRKDLTLESAQTYMFDLLLQFFPEPPAKVLDVGCGLGASAYFLAQKGFDVIAIGPSPDLISYARQQYRHHGVDYRVADFMAEDVSDFASDDGYDVILFQESLQYLHPLKKVFQRTRSLLSPKGKVILGDEMCYDNAITSSTSAHLRKEVIRNLAEGGFRISQQLSIGSRVLKTCDAILERFDMHRDRLLRIVASDNINNDLNRYIDGWGNQRRWYAECRLGYEVIVAQKDSVVIREYQDGDEAAILPLFRKVFGVERSLAHWRWKFKDNPFGACKIAVAYSEDHTLAAHFCGYPVPFHAPSETRSDFITLQGGDTMTNPSFRNSGLGATSLLSRVAAYFYNRFCEDETPFIYGFNTGVIRKFGERFLQYEYLSGIPYHVLDRDCFQELNAEIQGRMLPEFNVEKVLRVSGEFDDFFQNVCPRYGFLVKRSAKYLQWRYLACPERVHQMYTVKKQGRLVGWGVFRRSGDVLLWGDALFDQNCPQAVSELLHQVIDDNGSEINRIEGWFSPMPQWWTDILMRLNFRAQQEPNRLSPCFKHFDRSFSMEMLRQQYYYTMGDSDLF